MQLQKPGFPHSYKVRVRPLPAIDDLEGMGGVASEGGVRTRLVALVSPVEFEAGDASLVQLLTGVR